MPTGSALAQVGWIALLYIPKCVSFALPVSFLFAISYTLGLFYANNELFAIFGSGVSLHRLVLPFLVLGMALSVGAFFFEDAVVIPTFQMKNDAYAAAVKQTVSLSQSNVTVTSPDQRVVYQCDYYNDAEAKLTGRHRGDQERRDGPLLSGSTRSGPNGRTAAGSSTTAGSSPGTPSTGTLADDKQVTLRFAASHRAPGHIPEALAERRGDEPRRVRALRGRDPEGGAAVP